MNAHTIPYTNRRAILAQDKLDTINAARTAWGRRRTELFFTRLLDYKYPPRFSDIMLAIQHPLASIRYAQVKTANSHLMVTGSDLIIDKPRGNHASELTDDEVHHVRLARALHRATVKKDNPVQAELKSALARVERRLDRVTQGLLPTGRLQLLRPRLIDIDMDSGE